MDDLIRGIFICEGYVLRLKGGGIEGGLLACNLRYNEEGLPIQKFNTLRIVMLM